MSDGVQDSVDSLPEGATPEAAVSAPAAPEADTRSETGSVEAVEAVVLDAEPVQAVSDAAPAEPDVCIPPHDPDLVTMLATMIRERRFDEFNAWVARNGPANLTGANLRMTCLDKADMKGACLRGAYLRAVNMRGVDFSGADLEGASMLDAKVSGARFPDDLDAQEIMMSLQYGTRLRTR